MIAGVRHFSLLVVVAALTAAGCGSGGKLRTPERPGEALIVLLPDPGSGNVGRAEVSNANGSAPLLVARASTTASIGTAPTAPIVMSQADVERLFADVLAALPPEPRHFTLFFRFESDELTDESRALLPQVLEAVNINPGPEVTVVGHTDTTGQPAVNFELGTRRAAAVRALLVNAGLPPGLIELNSHGELDLLVPTADNVAEPRNRRVEISVR